MSFVQTTTTQAKYTALAYLAENGLKMALYTAEADLNADTLVYTTTNEVVGTGYTAGGKNLTNDVFIVDRVRGILPGTPRLVQAGEKFSF